MTGYNGFAFVWGCGISLSEPFRSIALPERYRIVPAFDPTSVRVAIPPLAVLHMPNSSGDRLHSWPAAHRHIIRGSNTTARTDRDTSCGDKNSAIASFP